MVEVKIRCFSFNKCLIKNNHRQKIGYLCLKLLKSSMEIKVKLPLNKILYFEIFLMTLIKELKNKNI